MTAPNLTSVKKHVGTAFKVMMDFKVLGLLMLNGMLLYGIGWDTVLRPNLEQLQGRDKALEEQKKALQEKDSLQKQYSGLEQQLKSLDTALIPVPEGNSSKVVSVTEAAELLELAKGNKRDSAVLPPLLPPHNKRASVTLTAIKNESFDLLHPDGVPAVGPQPPPATPPGAVAAGPGGAVGAPGAAAPMPGGGAPPGGDGKSLPVEAQPAHIGSTNLMVERYDYDLKVAGTYAALMDVLNELVIRRKLLQINKVTITRPATPAEAQPNAKDNPDYPVQLEMVVSLSMFLYPANAAPP